MINNVSQQKLVLKTAQELKGIIKMPEWANFVKTGSHRETMPRNLDWWYIRAASILRVVSTKGPVGVNKLRTRYGGRKNRGMKPDAFREASGKVIRVILQQLQEAELVKEHSVANRKGRVASPKGVSLLERCARMLIAEENGKEKTVKPKVEKTEEKAKPKEQTPVTSKPKAEQTPVSSEPKAEQTPVSSEQKADNGVQDADNGDKDGN